MQYIKINVNIKFLKIRVENLNRLKVVNKLSISPNLTSVACVARQGFKAYRRCLLGVISGSHCPSVRGLGILYVV